MGKIKKLTSKEIRAKERKEKKEVKKALQAEIMDLTREGEEIMCANCGTFYEVADSFYKLNNGDYICCEKCFVEYVALYFEPGTVKGKDLICLK